ERLQTVVCVYCLMGADHQGNPDGHWGSLQEQGSEPERSGPGALASAATAAAAVVATGLGSACCSKDCPKEQAAKSESFSVRCSRFPRSDGPGSLVDRCGE